MDYGHHGNIDMTRSKSAARGGESAYHWMAAIAFSPKLHLKITDMLYHAIPTLRIRQPAGSCVFED